MHSVFTQGVDCETFIDNRIGNDPLRRQRIRSQRFRRYRAGGFVDPDCRTRVGPASGMRRRARTKEGLRRVLDVAEHQILLVWNGIRLSRYLDVKGDDAASEDN